MDKEVEIALEKNEWDKVISLLKDKADLHSDKSLLEKLGWAYSRSEKYCEAVKCFETLIKMEPKMAKWQYMKGYQFYMQKDWQNAIDCFVCALELYPNYLIVKYRLAYSYFQISGNYMQYTHDSFWKGLAHLKESHSIYESYSSDQKEKEKHVYFDICYLHGKTIQDMNNKQAEAIGLLKRALEIKNDEDCQYQLSKTYFIAKDYDNAFYSLPKSDKYYVKELWAGILSEKEDFINSNRILLGLTEVRKKDYLFCKLAENYVKLKDFSNANICARKAISLGKENYKNYLMYGEVLYMQKIYNSSLANLERANELKIKKYNSTSFDANKLIEKIKDLIDENSSSNSKNCGVISSYNANKGYGFIFDEIEGTIFFHINDFLNGVDVVINEGIAVTYCVKNTKKGKSAYNITKLL